MSRSGYTDDCDDQWSMGRDAGMTPERLEDIRKNAGFMPMIAELLSEIDRLNKERLGWMEIVRRLEPARAIVGEHVAKTVYEKTYTVEQVVALDKENQALRAALEEIAAHS